MEKARIMLVEDEGIIAKDIRDSLEHMGYAVVAVETSGKGAIESAEREKPDLALMDIMLQGEMDGIEAAQEITSRFKIPVVYLTAYTDESVLGRVKLTDPYGYLIKPFEEKELRFAVEMALYRHRMENELRESRAQYQELVETAGAIPWEMDLATKTFSYVGPQAVNVLGYPLEAWVDFDSWARFIHPDDSSWAVNFCKEATSRSEDHEFEYRAIASDGRIVWLRDIVNVIQGDHGPSKLRGFMLDITTRRKAEMELRESEEKYRAMMDGASDAIFLSLPDGRLADANRKAEELTGYSKKELLSMHFSELHPEEEYEKINSAFEKGLKAGSGSISEITLKRKDGRTMTVDLSGSVVTFGGKTMAQAILRDVTERKLAESEREKLIRKLQDALENIKALKGLLPMCAWCKKIRNDSGYWQQVELYIQEHSDATFTHGMCPECREKLDEELSKGNIIPPEAEA